MSSRNSNVDVDDESNQKDAGFSLLPAALRARIDRAFDTVTRPSAKHRANPSRIHRSSKRRRLDTDHQQRSAEPALAGGFIVDEPQAQAGGFIQDDVQPGGFVVDDAPQAGGFLADDTDTTEAPSDRIPLSLIPSALQILDLQPDDEDTLAVFRNAASGWDDDARGYRIRKDEDSAPEGFVSRSDWRAVCAALLDTSDAVPLDDVADPGVSLDDEMHDEDEDSGSSDAYVDLANDDSNMTPASDDSDEDYVEGGFVPKAKSKRAGTGTPQRDRGRTRRSTRTTTSMDDSVDEDVVESPKRLTARQKEVCRSTFRLFFPDVRDEDLPKQKIMIKDITRVSKLLKEKIATEEVVEMLGMFSTSADKSMSLADFERMMVMAKLA